MHWKTLFVSQFLLLSFHHPLTAPLLSPKTRKYWPGSLPVQRVRARSSKPTASAHPISLPSAFQPGTRRHARHRLLITMPMPKPELASEKASLSVTKAGPGMERETLGESRAWNHQERSAMV